MIKKVFSMIVACALFAGLAVFASAEETQPRDWETAYTATINSYANKWGGLFELVDLDIDGSPELLLGSVPGSGAFSMIDNAFTYKNGAVQALTTDPECSYMSTGTGLEDGTGDYALYRNATTGECRVEGGVTLRAGAGCYSKLICDYGLAGNVLTMKNTFGKTIEAGITTEYYKEDQRVDKNTYDVTVAMRNRNYELISSYGYTETYVSGRKPSAAEIEEFFDSYKDGPVLALPSSHKVKVDGTPVDISAYNIGGNNFFKLRDLAYILNGTDAQFELGWDAAESKITLTTSKPYTPVGGEQTALGTVNKLGLPSGASLYADGKLVSPTAYNIDGNNYFKLRDMADFVGFGVDWDEATSTILITTQQWHSKVGTTLATITEGDGFAYYYGKGNLSANAGYDGQCTWYAYGRFYELTNIALKSARNAKYWLDENAKDSRVKVTTEIQAPAVAVRTSGNYGHVMFVEHVDYDANGKPVTVYFTECNWDNNGTYNEGKDCVLQEMTYEQFVQKRDPAGYVIAAE